MTECHSRLIDSARLGATSIRRECQNPPSPVAAYDTSDGSDAPYPASASINRTRLAGRMSVHAASIASRHS